MGAVQAVLSGIFIIYHAKSLYYKKKCHQLIILASTLRNNKKYPLKAQVKIKNKDKNRN